MKKRTIRATIVFALKDTFIQSKVVAIKYTSGENNGYYDLPGREIVDNIANSVKTAEWDFHEETGMYVHNLIYKGNCIIEKPKEKLDIDVYVSSDYEGKPQKFEDHEALWISTEKLLFSEKTFPTVEILRHLIKVSDFLGICSFPHFLQIYFLHSIQMLLHFS